MRNVKTRVLGRIDPLRSNIARVRSNLRFVDAYLDGPVDDAWFANLFRAKRPDAYSCDFSNFNALLPQSAWTEIADKCDKLKVLFTMRDPMKRLWSHIKFHLQVTGQTDVLDKWSPQELYDFAKRPFIWDNCEYGSTLRRLKAGLSEDMLHVQFYEHMFSDTDNVLADLERFLGIEPGKYSEERVKKTVNASANRPMPKYFPELFGSEMVRISKEVEDLGYKLPESWGV